MALFTAAVTKKNRETYSKTLLLNTKKVKDVYQDSDSKAVFYYNEKTDRRDKTDEYKYNGTREALKTKLRESDEQSFMDFSVNAIGVNNNTPPATVMTVNVDDIVKGFDLSNGTQSYIWFERGGFETVRLKVNHTIAEIDASASDSGSLA